MKRDALRLSSTILVLAALAACDGGEAASPDAGPSDGGAREAGRDVRVDFQSADEQAALAGVWAGTTDQKLPVSLVLSEGGLLTDFGVTLKLTYADGGTCTANFVADKLGRVVDGRLRLQLRSAVDSFRVPLELDLTTSPARGTIAGYTGKYRVRCYDEVGEGEGALLPAGTFTLQHVAGVTLPPPSDQRLAGGTGSPLPMGDMWNGCNEQPGSGQRFCAFARYGSLGEAQLWVVDTKQAAGCAELPGPGCQLLTSKLYLASPTAPTFSKFHGDTLLFRAEIPPAVGTTFAYHAWRPGWTEARPLSGASSCVADDTSDAVACVANYHKTAQGSWQLELLAGRLGDGSTPLRSVAQVLAVTSADAAKPSPRAIYQYALSAGGAYLLWSARPVDQPTAKEALWSLKLDDPAATPRMLAADAGDWSLSTDGKKLFWLTGIDRAVPGNPQPGYLEMVDFPEPGPPVRIGSALVSEYVEVDGAAAGPRQLLIMTTTGSLRHVPDAQARPAEFRVIDEKVSALRNWSPGAAAVAYSKTLSVDGTWGDLFVAVTASGAICQADAATFWNGPLFSSSGRYLLANHANFDPVPANHLTLIDSLNCEATLLAKASDRWVRIPGDRFVIETDPLPLRNYGLATVTLVDPVNAPLLSPQVAAVAGASVATTSSPGGDTLDVLYSINAGWKSDGLYRRTVKLTHR